MLGYRIGGIFIFFAGLVLFIMGVNYFLPRHKTRMAEMAVRESRVLLHENDLYGAEKRVREAIKIKPLNAEYNIILARVLEQQGEYDRAELAYREAYRFNISNPGALYLAAMMNFKMEKDQDAVKILEQLSVKHPNYVRPLNQLGYYYFSRAEYDKAKQYFERVIDIKQPAREFFLLPQSASAGDDFTDMGLEAEAYNGLGGVYHATDDLEKAKTMFEQALLINPYFEEAKRNLEIVNQELQ